MFRAMLAAAMLLAIGLSPSVALGQSQMTFFSEVGFGKMMEEGAPGGSVGFGVGMTVPLPIGEAFTGGPEIGYVMLGEEGNVTLSAIPITLQAYYAFPASGAVNPYATAGLGFYNSRAKIEIAGEDETTSDTNFGFNLGGGMKFARQDSKISFGADVKYHFVATEGETMNILTLFGRIYFK